jgi:hypothetical protein
MAQLKQLLPIKNKPVILHCIDAIIASGIDDIIAVVKDDSEALIKLLNGLPLRIVFNRNAESEMAESVRIGLHAAKASSTGVMVCLSDHPPPTNVLCFGREIILYFFKWMASDIPVLAGGNLQFFLPQICSQKILF